MKILSKRKVYLFLFTIIGVTAIIYLISFRTGHKWGGDFSQYIAQAKSIAEGYEFPGKFIGTYGSFICPWGFPLLLSPIYLIFGLNIFAMKIYVGLFYLLSLLMIFLLFEKKFGYIQTLLLVSIFALNPYFFQFKDNVLSDIPFFFFSLFSIFLIQQIVIERKIWLNKFVSYSLIGFFVFFSYLVRSQGIYLIPTLLLCQYISNRSSSKQDFISYLRSNKLGFIPYIIFVILVALINNIFPNGGSAYFRIVFSELTLTLIIGNVYYYSTLISVFFGNLSISMVFFGITIPFVVLGVIKNAKKDYLYLVYTFFTFLLIILWPARAGLRYIFPILPFYIYFFFVGLSKIPTSLFIPGKFNPLNWNLVNIVAIILILGSCMGIGIYCFRYPAFYNSNIIQEGPYTVESSNMFDYILKNTSEEDIIIFTKHRVMTLYTNRISKRILDFNQLMESKADYFVYSEHFKYFYSPSIVSQIENHKEKFKLVFQNNKFKIYKIMNHLF